MTTTTHDISALRAERRRLFEAAEVIRLRMAELEERAKEIDRQLDEACEQYDAAIAEVGDD